MENKVSLIQLVDAVKAEHEKLQYGEHIKRRLRYDMNRLLRFAHENNYEYYSLELGEKFKEFRCGRKISDADNYLRPFENNCRRSIRLLNYFFQTGGIVKDIKCEYRTVPVHFQKVNESFLEFQKNQIAPSSWLCCKRHTYRFFWFLDEHAIPEVAGITGEIISEYCKSFSGYDNCTIHTYLCDLRSLLRYLYEYEFITIDLTAFIPKFRLYQDTHLPTTWSPEEISQLLAAIGRTDPTGKRDYAMILIIAILGLRIGDVINLKFSNLNWREMKICLIQKKNLERVELPLCKDIAWAIIDYLKNGRPKMKSEYVFLKHIQPYGRFSEHNSYWVIFMKYLKIAGLSRKPRGATHSLRHSLASRMLNQKQPLADISGILGHANAKSTLCYLRIDIEDLRSCCLSFNGKEI